jgi:hypoxanthine phosphoribosyltransferase
MNETKNIQVLDKTFRLSIPSQQIQAAISRIAEEINRDFFGRDVIFLGILNGSFMFASDLVKNISFPCQITFLKVASYSGTSSSGTVKRLIGINENISGKVVILLEDIVDTGKTLEDLLRQLKGYEPGELHIATLLFKPEACLVELPLRYVGIRIPNDFIVGYGLDYDGFGRNFEDIYTLIDNNSGNE